MRIYVVLPKVKLSSVTNKRRFNQLFWKCCCGEGHNDLLQRIKKTTLSHSLYLQDALQCFSMGHQTPTWRSEVICVLLADTNIYHPCSRTVGLCCCGQKLHIVVVGGGGPLKLKFSFKRRQRRCRLTESGGDFC